MYINGQTHSSQKDEMVQTACWGLWGLKWRQIFPRWHQRILRRVKPDLYFKSLVRQSGMAGKPAAVTPTCNEGVS